MARPTKKREVRIFPQTTHFKSMTFNSTKTPIEIQYDELEAMRLTDIEGLSQEETARMLRVSRQTVQLMLESGRKKVTSALFEGTDLSLGGGPVEIRRCPFVCRSCGKDFPLIATNTEMRCPHCQSIETYCSSHDFCANHCARDRAWE